MGYFVGIPLGGATEKDYQVRFGKNMTFQVETRAPHLPAEWALQSGVQLTWPHANTDWAYMLEEVQQCFIAIASEIAKRELLLIVTPEPEEVRMQISAAVNMDNVRFLECETNDTWARDHGAITMVDTEGASLLDFTFNGWGLKFASDKDNQITRRAVEAEILKGRYMSRLGFVLEGGSIESDGLGTLLTTSECLLSPNRNGQLNKVEIEEYLRSTFHLERVLWLDYGYLAGDDTDSHIDTLARNRALDDLVRLVLVDRIVNRDVRSLVLLLFADDRTFVDQVLVADQRSGLSGFGSGLGFAFHLHRAALSAALKAKPGVVRQFRTAFMAFFHACSLFSVVSPLSISSASAASTASATSHPWLMRPVTTTSCRSYAAKNGSSAGGTPSRQSFRTLMSSSRTRKA